jgi:hypothetical protein
MKKGCPVYVKTEDGFDIFITQPVWKSIICTPPAYIYNTETNENMGQAVYLVDYIYNLDGSINENPKSDRDIYKVRFVDV